MRIPDARRCWTHCPKIPCTPASEPTGRWGPLGSHPTRGHGSSSLCLLPWLRWAHTTSTATAK
jgi:hypothetical protein